MTRVRLPLLPAWIRWSTFLAVAGVVWYASVMMVPPEGPVVVEPPDLIPLDKWRHFFAYAGVGGALAYATADWEWPTWRLAALVLGVTVAYGAGIEVWQSFVPVRYFSPADAYANALGAVLVAPFYAVRSRLAFVPVGQWIGGLVGDEPAGSS